jgi:dipeptidyl aminopeptidase/acylaminoacyl peptidase
MLLRLFLIAASSLSAQDRWTPDLSFQVQTVSTVVPSPDGAWVAYTQTRHVIEEERSEQVSQVWLAAADGSRRRQLTFSDKSATAPSFSPDSRSVYFRSSRTGTANVWRIAIDGGEAQPLAKWKGAIGEYAPSPDGKWIAFAGVETSPDEEKRIKQKRDFKVIGESPKNHALWLLPAGETNAVPRRITPGNRHIANLHWAADSQSIVFEHWPTPGADDWVRADLAEVTISTAAVQEITKTPAAESQPYYSPDGRYIAFVQTPDRARWPGDARLAILNRKDRSVRLLPATADERPLLLGWNPASNALYFGEMKRTRSGLYAMPLDGPPKLVYEPRKGTFFSGYGPNATLNAKGDTWGFAREASDEAPEAYVAKLPAGEPLRVSSANTALRLPPIGETKPIEWKSKDGQVVEGLLTLPVGYRPGTRVPLILNIHGGPANHFAEVFLGKAGIYPLAVFASKGFAILRPNPRGSGGYGKTFRFANIRDWGGGDYDDIMTGVDHLINTGIADGDRMAVMGWSYGGFMSSWVVTHTKRFKAAVVGAAVTNLWSFTGTADIPGFLPDYFQGEPWEAFEEYRQHSPMTFVKGVATPSLILHGEADDRVPVSQGYEFYNALKRQGVEVAMVVYPRTPHSPQEPKFMADIMQRHLDWVDRFIPMR